MPLGTSSLAVVYNWDIVWGPWGHHHPSETQQLVLNRGPHLQPTIMCVTVYWERYRCPFDQLWSSARSGVQIQGYGKCCSTSTRERRRYIINLKGKEKTVHNTQHISFNDTITRNQQLDKWITQFTLFDILEHLPVCDFYIWVKLKSAYDPNRINGILVKQYDRKIDGIYQNEWRNMKLR